VSGLLPPNVLSYEGQVVVPFINRTSDPTTSNFQFNVPTVWVNTASETGFILLGKPLNVANWAAFAGVQHVDQLEGNSGGPVSPDTSGIIHVVGDTTTINIVGNPGTNTLTASTTGSIATVYTCDTGSATPLGGNLNVLGGAGASTTGSGSTITIVATGSETVNTLTGNSGGAVLPTGGNINTVGSGSVTVVGNPGTSTLTSQLTGLTNHNVLIGAGTDTITKVAPSSTSGVPLISQGASADPTFGTVVVEGGGTGDTSFTAYSVITGGTTSTGALQNVSGVGTAGQFLTSNGAGALPSWQSGGSGIAKAWGQFAFDSSGNFTSILSSFNVTSVSGTGGGPYTVTLTNGFSSSNYVVTTLASLSSQNTVPHYTISSSTVFSLTFGTGLSGSSGYVGFVCFGL